MPSTTFSYADTLKASASLTPIPTELPPTPSATTPLVDSSDWPSLEESPLGGSSKATNPTKPKPKREEKWVPLPLSTEQTEKPFYRSRPNRGRGGSSNGGGRGFRQFPKRSDHQQDRHFFYYSRQLEMMKPFIIAQVEYYFSLENLVRDVYFRKMMDASGWVGIEVIAGFNRMKFLNVEVGMVKDALKSSGYLEIDQDGEKVRLKEGWARWLLNAGQ